jgi:integrase
MVARRCYDAIKGGKDRRNLSWLSSLENHVFDDIGAKRIDAIDRGQVLKMLEPIWLDKPDTARRILQRIGTVLDYAHIKGLIPAEISLRSVTRRLPRQTRQVEHRAAMLYANVPAFLRKLAQRDRTIGRDALQLTILTASGRTRRDMLLGRVRSGRRDMVDPGSTNEDEAAACGAALRASTSAAEPAPGGEPSLGW